jgi:hypothetical protein
MPARLRDARRDYRRDQRDSRYGYYDPRYGYPNAGYNGGYYGYPQSAIRPVCLSAVGYTPARYADRYWDGYRWRYATEPRARAQSSARATLVADRASRVMRPAGSRPDRVVAT